MKQGLCYVAFFFECFLSTSYPQNHPSSSTDVTTKHPRGTTSVMPVSTMVRSCHCASHARHDPHVLRSNLIVCSIGFIALWLVRSMTLGSPPT